MRRTPVFLSAAVVTFLIAAVPPVSANTPTGADSIEAPVQGQEAIDALGSDLPAIAAEHDLTAAQFKTVLRNDEGIRVGPNGRLIATAPAAPAGLRQAPIAAAANWDWNSIPDSEVFNLSSKPGAAKTIYLNFTGWSVKKKSDSFWAKAYGMPTAVTGYDLDGSPSTFNATERRAIKWIWAAVAEDFAPFDVNVTTKKTAASALERANSKDKKFGSHVVITSQKRPADVICQGLCSGVAFVGTFDHYKGKKYAGKKDKVTSRAYQPAWVFARNTGGSASYVADVASHEAGHNLGLFHTGLRNGPEYYAGHNNWSPIMGTSVDSFGTYRPLSQWSNDTRPRFETPQDQLAVMRSHGLTWRPDESGSTVAESEKITSGVIGNASDKDTAVLGYCASNRSITIETATMANLDARVELLNASGTVIESYSGNTTSSKPTGLSGLGFPGGDRIPSNTNVTFIAPAGGPFHVRVSGEGSTPNNYSSYGSLGQWRLDNTCAGGTGPAPGAPANLKAVAGNKKVTLSWQWPTTGRIQDITGWRIIHTDTGKVVKTHPTSTRTATITGLPNGKPVTFQVVAETPAGNAIRGSVTVTPHTVPSAPKIGTASHGVAGGAITATVRWAAAKDNGGPITHYQVEARRYKGKKIAAKYPLDTVPAANGLELEPTLPMKADYAFVVRAKNAAGWSKWSKPSKKVKGR